MKVNDVLRKGDVYLRVLAIRDESCFCINCNASSMPVWMPACELEAYTQEDAPTVNTDLTVRQKQISREQNLGDIRRFQKCRKIKGFRE